MLGRTFLPLFSVLVPVAWIHALHAAYVLDIMPSTLGVVLLFAPVLAWEWAWSGWFARASGRRARRERAWIVARCAVWTAVFFGWVVAVGHQSNVVLANGEEWKWLKWVGPKIYINVGLVLWGMAPFTALAVAIWAAIYVRWTVIKGGHRMTTALGVPVGLGGLIFAHLYMQGGLGGLRSTDGQIGVSRAFSVLSLEGRDTVRNHPRGVCVDAKAEFALVSFGCTFCPSAVRYPSLVRVELSSGRATDTFFTGPIREFDCTDGPTQLIAPWQDSKVFLLDRDTLQMTHTFVPAFAAAMEIWEPMASVHDEVNHRLFIVNDVEPAISVLDADDGHWLGAHNLYREGLTGYGLAAQALVQPTPGGTIFFTAGDGENLFAMDPKSLSLRHVPLDDAVGTALAVDTAGDRLWYQPSLRDAIQQIRISDLSVTGSLRGERFSRGLAFDSARGVLYVLGYFSGQFFAVDVATGQRRWQVNVGGRPNSLVVRDDVAWINSMSGLVRVDLSAVWAAQP